MVEHQLCDLEHKGLRFESGPFIPTRFPQLKELSTTTIMAQTWQKLLSKLGWLLYHRQKSFISNNTFYRQEEGVMKRAAIFYDQH